MPGSGSIDHSQSSQPAQNTIQKKHSELTIQEGKPLLPTTRDEQDTTGQKSLLQLVQSPGPTINLGRRLPAHDRSIDQRQLRPNRILSPEAQ